MGYADEALFKRRDVKNGREGASKEFRPLPRQREPALNARFGGHERSRVGAPDIPVMPGLVPGIHALLAIKEKRGWPGQARP